MVRIEAQAFGVICLGPPLGLGYGRASRRSHVVPFTRPALYSDLAI
jgi:hypothetical protein